MLNITLQVLRMQNYVSVLIILPRRCLIYIEELTGMGDLRSLPEFPFFFSFPEPNPELRVVSYYFWC